MTLSDDPTRLVQAARRVLTLSDVRPYLARGLFSMPIVVTDKLGAHDVNGQWHPFPLATDKWWRLYVNPEPALKMAHDGHLVGGVYHEVMHQLRGHPARAAILNAEPMLWNLAADMEINDDLIVEGRSDHRLDLPAGIVAPGLFGFPDGLTAEDYYRRLVSLAAEKGRRAVLAIGACNCGSGAHGQAQPWEAPDGESRPGPDGRPVPAGLSDVDGRLLVRAVIHAAKQRGNLPGGLEDMIDVYDDPRIPWQQQLARRLRGALTAAGAYDYTWSRPSRRQNPFVALPAVRAPQLRVDIVQDTSGSMAGVIAAAQREVSGIARAAGTTPRLIECDAEVQRIRHTRSARSDLKGWGGTDMRVGIEHALRQRPRPDVIIVLTDGYTPWPEQRPPVPIVVGIVGDGDVESVPSWARVVEIPA